MKTMLMTLLLCVASAAWSQETYYLEMKQIIPAEGFHGIEPLFVREAVKDITAASNRCAALAADPAYFKGKTYIAYFHIHLDGPCRLVLLARCDIGDTAGAKTYVRLTEVCNPSMRPTEYVVPVKDGFAAAQVETAVKAVFPAKTFIVEKPEAKEPTP